MRGAWRMCVACHQQENQDIDDEDELNYREIGDMRIGWQRNQIENLTRMHKIRKRSARNQTTMACQVWKKPKRR